jgi:Fe-S cluster assembly protein SufD
MPEPMSTLEDHLEQQLDALPAPTGAQPWRRAAWQRFRAQGLPTRRSERWHYTDLSSLARQRFEVVSGAPDGRTRADAAALIEANGIAIAGPQLVFLDGRFDSTLSTAAASPGVDITELREAAHDVADTDSASAPPVPALAELNTAFAQSGTLLRVRRGTRLAAPIRLVMIATGRAAPTLAQARLRIELEADTAAVFVQHFLDLPGAVGAWLNAVTEIAQQARSRCTLYRVQEHGEGQFHTSSLRARLARDAVFTAGYVERGGKLVRNDIDVTLAEPGASADLFGVLLAAGQQHIDNTVEVDHRAEHTRSTERFRAVVDDSARGVFCGKVIVRPGAQRIDAQQSSDNLLLSEQAEIDTKPELEIYADDVKCSHGATIGELDSNHLFYLRSRGIEHAAARALLTFAFVNVVLERIELREVREHAVRVLAAHLPEAFGGEDQS